jgi:peptide subunit release factor 1 (eRF1)
MSTPIQTETRVVRDLLAELARIDSETSRVVTAYVATRWADEHQRDRTRVFLKHALARARAEASDADLVDDLDWIEAEGARLVDQAELATAAGVALFACRALGLRERRAFRIPCDERLVVGDRPALTELVRLAAETAPLLVVFVDGESARLISVGADGEEDEVDLRHDVIGRHRQGGWALLAQSRYRRHIEATRSRHFEAVVEAVADVVDAHGIAHVVLAGEDRAVSLFQEHLPAAAAARVVGTMPAPRYETASELAARALDMATAAIAAEQAAAVASVLVEAAKSGRAVAGMDSVLDAIGRGAVHRLFVARGLDVPGRRCTGCGAVQPGREPRCVRCGGATRTVSVVDEVIARAIATGSAVDVVAAAQLREVGGIAGQLRYPL